MRKAEFFSLTMRQWYALRECGDEIQRQQNVMPEFMLAQLTANLPAAMRGYADPLKTSDFMPSERRREMLKRARETPDDINDRLRRQMSAMRMNSEAAGLPEFDRQIYRTMERAVSYQAEQVRRGTC